MTKRSYVFWLECPRCKQTSTFGSNQHRENPHLNCADCLINENKLVELKIVKCKVVTATD